MAWSNGVYSRLYSWVTDRDNAIKVRADRMDGEFDEIVTALNALTSGGVSHIAAMRGYSGSAALPGYSFDGDLNSGFYRIGADNVGIAVNGTKIVDVAATGVGITGAITGSSTIDAAKGSNVASGGTLNLDTATGMFPDVTGTTTVTAITLAAGKLRMARARGIFQLTASASLIVNNSTTEAYVCADGDLLICEGYASSVVRVQTVSGGADTTTEGRLDDLETTVDFLSVVVADLYGNYLGMARGWSDGFDTEDGIDTSASTNESYNAAGDYYTPTATSPSNQIVAHVGSNTSASGTISASAEDAPAYNAANGSDSEANYWITASGSGWLKYAFTAAKTIATYEVTACVTSFSRYPTDWTLEGSATGSFGGEQVVLDTRAGQSFSVAQVRSFTIASPASYQYYRLNISASSNGANLTVIEWRLKDAGTPNNMTLISNEFAAPANVGMTAAFLDLEFASALTAGTDFDFAMTSATSPSYTSTGATYSLWYSSGNTKRYVVEGIDLTSQADDEVRARFRTLTNKAIKITGWRPRWSDA